MFSYIPTTRTHQRHVTIPRLDNYTHVTYCKIKNNLYTQHAETYTSIFPEKRSIFGIKQSLHTCKIICTPNAL